MRKEIKIFCLLATIVLFSCNDRRHPGRIYMPDMTYSRAYEANAPNDLAAKGINYLPFPVPGTIRRGDLFPYTLSNDSNGYKLAIDIKDPLPPLDSVGLNEAHRLFNINCAICHGPNLDAQGPLAGKVGGIANLKMPQYVKEPEGQMFHVVTYGKNNMGSYASQLDRRQRWMVIQFIKSEQAKISAPKDSVAAGSGTTKDSTMAKK
ncbi:MAG: cytochrome c [Chitinophagaceae bacterium]|nr:cytochrome c [Chitinophagaceae bacterium]